MSKKTKSDLEGLAAKDQMIQALNGPNNTKSTRGKYTTILAHKICDHISNGVPLIAAAVASGISNTTIHRWRREKPEFNEMIEQAIGVSEARLAEAIANYDDWRAKAWILERRFPERWSKREQIDMNVSKSEGLEEIKMMMKQTDKLLGIENSDQEGENRPDRDQ